VEVNPAAEHLFGYRRDALVGRATTDVAGIFTTQDQVQMRTLLAAHGRIVAFACTITSRAGTRTACLVYRETLEVEGAHYLITQLVTVSPQDPPL
jgi:PAS domain S-box-containing protein